MEVGEGGDREGERDGGAALSCELSKCDGVAVVAFMLQVCSNRADRKHAELPARLLTGVEDLL